MFWRIINCTLLTCISLFENFTNRLYFDRLLMSLFQFFAMPDCVLGLFMSFTHHIGHIYEVICELLILHLVIILANFVEHGDITEHVSAFAP